MTDHRLLQAFCWSAYSVQTELHRTHLALGLEREQSVLSGSTHALIAPYVRQFSSRTEEDADFMTEHYKLFYMLENEIRDFVSQILEAEDEHGWWQNLVPDAVAKSAERNRSREVKEGVTVRSSRNIDYINFGELGEIIKSNWSVFAGVFSNSDITAIEKVMARLNMLRNYIAHCSAFGDDEILRLHLTIRDWFRLME